jgi:hypothetical protein
MKKFYFKMLFLTLLLFIVRVSVAQDLPPIVKYNAPIYGAGNHNWMISQDKSQFI